jgi:hypothetical protein
MPLDSVTGVEDQRANPGVQDMNRIVGRYPCRIMSGHHGRRHATSASRQMVADLAVTLRRIASAICPR